jgi:hypothetical protein
MCSPTVKCLRGPAPQLRGSAPSRAVVTRGRQHQKPCFTSRSRQGVPFAQEDASVIVLHAALAVYGFRWPTGGAPWQSAKSSTPLVTCSPTVKCLRGLAPQLRGSAPRRAVVTRGRQHHTTCFAAGSRPGALIAVIRRNLRWRPFSRNATRQKAGS